MSLFRYAYLCLAFTLVPGFASAVIVNYAAEGGVYRSDNIKRTDTGAIEDTVYKLDGQLEVIDQNTSNDFAMKLDVQHRDFKDDSFKDDTRGVLDLKSSWSIISDGLSWDVDGYFGQRPINVFAVETPDNQQDVGFFSTGPNATVRITDLDQVDFGYRYNDFYAEITDADYVSDQFDFSVTRRFSSIYKGSLVTKFEDLDYKEPGVLDFEDLRYFFRFTGNTRSNQMIIDLGKIDIKYNTGEKLKNDYKRLSFLRRLNRTNTAQIQYIETIDNGARQVDQIINPNVVTTDLFVNEQFNVAYTFDRTDIRFLLNYSYTDQDYSTQHDLDRIIRTGSFRFIYGLPSVLRFTLGFNRFNTDFYNGPNGNPPRVDEDDIWFARFEKRIREHLNIGLEGKRLTRESTSQNLNYEENVYLIFLRYEVKDQ